MITRFFNDVIFREEDVIFNQTCLPGDLFKLDFDTKEPCEVFVVRIGEKLLEEGE